MNATTTTPSPADVGTQVGDVPGAVFEGKTVDGVRIKFTGLSSAMECDDVVVGHDDLVRITIECRVTDIDHKVDKSGNINRVQTLALMDLQFTPWDPNNPNDKGIIKAGP